MQKNQTLLNFSVKQQPVHTYRVNVCRQPGARQGKRNRGASLGSGASTEWRRDLVGATICRGHVQRRGNGVSHEGIKVKIKADVPLRINRHNTKVGSFYQKLSRLAWNSSRTILPKSEEECLFNKEESEFQINVPCEARKN